MKECVTLTRKEQTRLLVLGKVDRGEVTASEAAALLGVGLRQVRRLLASYCTEGVAALAHGNRGRHPSRPRRVGTRVHTVDDGVLDRTVRNLGSTSSVHWLG
jgi:hypothetical protein